MADGGRKFNVWIAYSDLFSNLMTFLFISAFGMFAAIGSGVMFNGQGSIDVLRSECIAPQRDVDAALHSQVSGHGYGFLEPDTDAVCETTYAVKDSGSLKKALREIWSDHRSPGYGLPVDPMDLVVKNDQLMQKICPQLWTAAALKPLKYLSGHLEILAAVEAGAQVTACPSEAGPPPKWIPFRSSRYPFAGVRSCYVQFGEGRRLKGRDLAHRYRDYSSICPVFEDCFSGLDSGRECETLMSDLLRRQVDEKERCRIRDAVERASLLYESCRIAIRSKDWPWDDTVNTPNSMLQRKVGNYISADDTWTHRVRYGAEMDGDGASSSRRSGFVVKVVFDPKEVDDWMNPKDNAELSGWTTEELPAK